MALRKLRITFCIVLLLAMSVFISSAEGDKLSLNMKDSFSLGEYVTGEVTILDSNSPTDKIVACKIVSEDGSRLLNVEEFKFQSNRHSFSLGYPLQTLPGKYIIELYFEGQSIKKTIEIVNGSKISLAIDMSDRFVLGDKIQGTIKLEGLDENTVKVVTYKIMDEFKSKIVNIGEFKFSGNLYNFSVEYPNSTIVGSYQMTAGINGVKSKHDFNIEEKIIKVVKFEDLADIKVTQGMDPQLPKMVTAYFDDGSTVLESVTWDKVDTSVVGTQVVNGKVFGDKIVTVNVKVIEPTIVKVEKFDDIAMVQGTEALLPLNVIVSYNNGTMKSYPITWDKFDASKSGFYKVIGTALNDIKTEVNITVVDAKIIGHEKLNDISIYRGSDINLPEFIKVKLDNGKPKLMPVKWENKPNSLVEGDYTVSGVVADTYKVAINIHIMAKEKNESSSGNQGNPGGSSTGNTNNSGSVVIKDEKLPESSSKSESAKLAIKAKESIALESFKDGSATAKNVIDKIKSDLSNTTSLNNMGEVAKESTDLVMKLVSKKDATYEESKEIIKDVIGMNAEIVSKDGSIKKDMAKIKKDIISLVDKAINLSGKIEASERVVADNGKVNVKLDKNQILAAVNNSVKSAEELKKSVSMISTDLTKKVKPTVVLDLGSSSESEQLEVIIGKELELHDKQVDLVIKSDDLQMKIPKELISKDKNIEFNIKRGDDDLKSAVSKSSGNNKSTDVVLDINLKSEDVNGIRPTIEIDVAELGDSGYDLDKLGIYIFDETTNSFEFVKSELIDGKLVFVPPHFSIYTVMQSEVEFKDMSNHWAKDTVEVLASKKIISGNPNGEFAPNSDITRAEFISILVNTLGLDGDAKSNFADVDSSAWYYKNVGLANKYGITNGDGVGNFNPNSKISRQDMAVMISRAFKIAHSEDLVGDTVKFTDKNDIASYAMSAVEGAKYHGIISGYEDGTFGPERKATRAEAAKMILNFIKY